MARTRVTPAPGIRKRGEGRVTAQMRGHRVANRENLAYCFTVCPSGGSSFVGSRGILSSFPREEGTSRKISKCPGIIKVYRFTGERFSYANVAAGHPLGLFLQIFHDLLRFLSLSIYIKETVRPQRRCERQRSASIMIYGVPLAGEVKRNGRDYGNHCKLEIYTGNCFLDMGKLLFQRNENIICLMGNSVSITN